MQVRNRAGSCAEGGRSPKSTANSLAIAPPRRKSWNCSCLTRRERILLTLIPAPFWKRREKEAGGQRRGMDEEGRPLRPCVFQGKDKAPRKWAGEDQVLLK